MPQAVVKGEEALPSISLEWTHSMMIVIIYHAVPYANECLCPWLIFSRCILKTVAGPLNRERKEERVDDAWVVGGNQALNPGCHPGSETNLR